MPKFTSADIGDRAKAGMEAFGKGKKKMKGPMKGGALPFGKKDPAEPDADDVGKGQGKKMKRGQGKY